MAALLAASGRRQFPLVAPSVTTRVSHVSALRNARDRNAATWRLAIRVSLLLPLLTAHSCAQLDTAVIPLAMLWDMDVTQLNENANARSILKLPAEILLEVLSLLSVADLLSFREVSCPPIRACVHRIFLRHFTRT